MTIKFTENEIRRLQQSPEAMQLVIDINECWICEGEAMGFNCSGNEERIKQLKAEKKRLEDEI